VVRGNRLIVPGRDEEHDLVFCLDPADGTLTWKSALKVEAGPWHGTGARATPYIDGDRVYTFGRSGDLVAWKLLDGARLWHRNVGDEGGNSPKWGNSSSPLVIGRLVVVQGGGAARTIAFDKMTGQVAWKAGTGPAGYAAIAATRIGDVDTVLTFHATGLVCVDLATGRELWDAPWKTPRGITATTPVVERDTVFISTDYGRGGKLLRMEQSKATPLWENREIASHHSDPFFVGGHIYGFSGSSAQNRGYFKCLEAATGRLKWSTGEMGWGTCVAVDGHLLCCDIEGNLFLMRPDPERFIKVTELRGALGEVNSPSWTIPVIANGRLYLRYKQRLVCYSVVPAS
jgi:outer membrane protein assembly factor BamB